MELKFAVKKEMLGASKKVLFITDRLGPTYYLACHLPFLNLQQEMLFSFYTIESKTITGYKQQGLMVNLLNAIDNLRPQVVIFSRIQEEWAIELLETLKKKSILTIYFLDDNFFSLPDSSDNEVLSRLGLIRDSISIVHDIISRVNYIWCSTEHLTNTIKVLFPKSYLLKIPYPTYFHENWSDKSLIKKLNNKILTIGYYGSFLHRDDLEMIAPELKKMLKKNLNIEIEIHGNILIPGELTEFRNRVRQHKPTKDYIKFRSDLKNNNWCLSIAPLRFNEFNLSRSPIKYFESTAAGIPFISSKIEVYSQHLEKVSGTMVENNANWSETILEALSNKKKLILQLNDAHQYCDEFYGIDQTIKAYMNFFGEVINGQKIHNSKNIKLQIRKFFNF